MHSSQSALPPHVVTKAIHQIRAGDPDAEHTLWTLLYDSFRERARMLLHGDGLRGSVWPTEIVHQAYSKLGSNALGACGDRWHVLGVATRAMRQVLVEEAKRRACRRAREKAWAEERFAELAAGAPLHLDDRLDIALAIEALAAVNPDYAKVVSLRHYAGLSSEQIAGEMNKCRRSVELIWFRARAWLHEWLVSGRRDADAVGNG